jgi:hypothetical protein
MPSITLQIMSLYASPLAKLGMTPIGADILSLGLCGPTCWSVCVSGCLSALSQVMEAGGFEPPDSHSIRYSRPADIVVWCPVIRTYVGGADGLKGQYQNKLFFRA